MSLERTAIPDNILDRIEELERRFDELAANAVMPQGAFNSGDDTASLLSGWVIDGGVLRDTGSLIVLDPSVPGIRVAPDGRIYSSDYVAATSGFNIDGGTAEFNDVVVRGTIYADAGELGDLTITGVIDIDAAGGIYQGSGTFAMPDTGMKIWNNVGEGGQGEISFYVDGTMVLDLAASTSARVLLRNTATGLANIIFYSDGDVNDARFELTNAGIFSCKNYNLTGAPQADPFFQWYLSDGAGLVYPLRIYNPHVVTSEDLRVGGGLHVGAIGTDPADNTISADGFITSLVDGSGGGLRAGSSADVQWYRGAANTWQTPDSLMVDGQSSFGGAGISAGIGLNQNYTTASAGGLIYGIAGRITANNTTATAIAGYFRALTTNAAFTLGNAVDLYLVNPSKGAASTITNAYGLFIEDITVGGTLNYAIKTNGGRVGLVGLSSFAGNAAAIAGGLVAGDLYRDGSDPDLVCVVH